MEKVIFFYFVVCGSEVNFVGFGKVFFCLGSDFFVIVWKVVLVLEKVVVFMC